MNAKSKIMVIVLFLSAIEMFTVPASADSCSQNLWASYGRAGFTGSNVQITTRCDESGIYVYLGSRSGTLTFDFDWSSQTISRWGESPQWQVFVNGAQAYSDGFPAQPWTSSSHITKSLSVNGNVVLLFRVVPSSYCSSGDHGDTMLWIDNVVVKDASSTIFSDSFNSFSPYYAKCGSAYSANNCYIASAKTCVDAGNGIAKLNNGQPCSYDYQCANKYCNGGACSSCSGNLKICGSNWNNYGCYDDSVKVCIDNANGIAKKRFRQSCSSGSECSGGHCGVDSRCEDVFDMADITANCPYDSVARTYSCAGWDNIYVQADIGLPNIDCGYGRIWGTTYLSSCNPTNIVFKANNDFSAKNFYATNGGGYGGFINIEAKKITANSLNTYGTECKSSACTSGSPQCRNSNGGDVTLKADTVNVGTINANQGGGVGGTGGKVMITANAITVTNIYSNGGYYGGCSDANANGGSGGQVIVKSSSNVIGLISMNGGGGWGGSGGGGSGGSAKISANTMSLGTIVAGGGGGRWQGSGGNIKIYNDAYTLSSISASGPGGYIAFFTDAAYPTASKLGAATVKTGKRTGSGFFVFETNVPSQYASYRAKLKDFMGQYVKSIYNVEWSQTGAIKNGKISGFMGAMAKMNIKIGNDYTLELTASPDALFDEARCAGRCAAYGVPFSAY